MRLFKMLAEGATRSRQINTILIVFGLITGAQAMAADRITGKPFATRSEVIAQNGMVASSHPLATQIGLQILKDGGNAIDAQQRQSEPDFQTDGC